MTSGGASQDAPFFILFFSLSMLKSIMRQDNLLSRLQIGDLVCKTVWNGVMVVSRRCQTKKAEKKLVNPSHLVYDIIGGFDGVIWCVCL